MTWFSIQPRQVQDNTDPPGRHHFHLHAYIIPDSTPTVWMAKPKHRRYLLSLHLKSDALANTTNSPLPSSTAGPRFETFHG